MIPTLQNSDDCLRACVSSILNLSLSRVPHFCDDIIKCNTRWWFDLCDFLYIKNFIVDWSKYPKYTGNYNIGVGPVDYDPHSKELHGVVCKGKDIVWNPSGYGKNNLTKIIYHINLEKIK